MIVKNLNLTNLLNIQIKLHSKVLIKDMLNEHEQINKCNSKNILSFYSPFSIFSNKLIYQFSRNVKTSQAILYSPQQISNIHHTNQRKKLKQNQSKPNQQRQWQVFKQKSQKFKVSLVGLPNSGKSSLFNCIIGQRLAIVDKQYGLTRDRRQFSIFNGMVSIIDTPGIQVNLLTKSRSSLHSYNSKQYLQQQTKSQLKNDIFQQTINAINQSDVILFVIDAKKQIISESQIILSKYLKAFNANNKNGINNKKCQILIVCNKCDGYGWDQNYLLNQIYSKISVTDNLQSPKQNLNNEQSKKQNIFYTSAQQGTGIFELLQYINTKIPKDLRQFHQNKRKQRRQKFQKLIKKIKEQIKQINQSIEKAPGNQNKAKQKQFKQEKQQLKTNSDNVNEDQIIKKHKANLKRIKIKDWQKDFRQLNPLPQDNQQLDSDNYEDFFIRPQEAFSSKNRGVDIKNLKMKHSIKICFIGRPNVGKSSLINQIIGQQKLVVSEVPHTTRDSMATKILYKNRKIEIIDTAGLNTPRIAENQEQFLQKVQYSTMLHVRQSHVVCYVMDSFNDFKVDDFTLINKVIEQGRPIVIVVNKWQAIKQQYKNKAKNYLISQIDKNLGQLHGHPIVFVSAKMALNIDHLMDKIINMYDKWNKRISTGLLNNWLQKFKKLDNLPKDQQATLKINYIIQGKVRPPHFIMFVNNKLIFKKNYMRFLMKNIAQQFQLDGIPLRSTLRSTNNKENAHRKPRKHSQPRKTKLEQKMQELKKKYGDFNV